MRSLSPAPMPVASSTINVYCDESCHLEHDGQAAMTIGAIWCPEEKSREVASRLREIKRKHNLNPHFELKWTKVSPAKLDYYLDVLDYFFEDMELHFRALVVPDKTLLRHKDFGQDHNTFYYKMYFEMLKLLLSPEATYHIYIDTKDTNSATKVAKLHDVLANNRYDFRREIVARIQTVRSHEVEQIQLADLLIGIVSTVNRGQQSTSAAKKALITRMRERSHYQLDRSTLLREQKVNLFRWLAQ